MCRVPCGIVGCLVLILATSSRSAKAQEYSVEWTKNGDGSQLVDIVPGEVKPTPWHTINDSMGVNLRNRAGFRIKSIRIKASAANVTFRVVKPTADPVFPTIWKRKDNTEVAFLDGDIGRSAIVWNRVNDTSGATGTTGNIFEGQIYTENYTIPDPDNWERVPPVNFAAATGQWKELLLSLPDGYNAVEHYAEAPDGNRVYFISRGFPFMYDFKTRELRSILVPKLIPKGINQIIVTKTEVVFWKNGSKIDTVPLDEKARFDEIIRKDVRK